MESRSIQQQLRYLQDRIELLHANLQAVSSKTLSNSRTCSLEDRLNQLEQDQQPPAPSLASEILDDISRQMGIFDQQLQTLENKIKNYLDKMDEKIQCCNTKVNTMNGWNNGGKKTISRLTETFPPHWPLKQHKSNIFWKFYRNTGWTKTNQKTRPDHLWSISPNGDRAHHQQNDHAALLLDYIKAARLMTSNSDGTSKKDLSTETAFLRLIFFFTFNF